MKAKYQHISNSSGASFQIEKYDNNRPCIHEGLHFHHDYEIVFIRNGKGKIIVEDKQMNYDDGVLIFLGPCLPHFSFSNKTYEDNYEIVIHFDEKFVQQRIKPFPEFSTLIPFIYTSKQVLIFSTEVKNKQQSLFENIIHLNPMEQLVTIFNLLCQLSTSTKHQSLIAQSIGDRYAQNKQVKEIFDFINKNYSNSVSTKDIAQHVGLTTNSFCKVFKKISNKSFIKYLNEYRIHRAAKLIEETDDNISEIAYTCGFENLSYFSKVFFQMKHYTPLEYRKNYRDKD